MEELTIKNCLISEKIDIGMELLPSITKCRSLCLEATPEFATNKNTCKFFKHHIEIYDKFFNLKISPYYCPKNFNEFIFFENVSESPVQLTIFVTCLAVILNRVYIGKNVNISFKYPLHIFFLSVALIMKVVTVIFLQIIRYFEKIPSEHNCSEQLLYEILVDNGTPWFLGVFFIFVLNFARFSLYFLLLDELFCFSYRLSLFFNGGITTNMFNRYIEHVGHVISFLFGSFLALQPLFICSIMQYLIRNMQLFNALLLILVVELYFIVFVHLLVFFFVSVYVD